MCLASSEIFGSGDVLVGQILTIIAITASILFWICVYRKQKIELKQYAIPITLWVVFGALDIMITAKGTFYNPMREGNPFARAIFTGTDSAGIGILGPAVASILWISLWAGIVLAVNKIADHIRDGGTIVKFLSLVIFYSLAVGHFFGFSSWFQPLCWLPQALHIPIVKEISILELVIFAAIGTVLSIVHIIVYVLVVLVRANMGK